MDDQKKHLTRREVLIAGAGVVGVAVVASAAVPVLAQHADTSTSAAASSSLPVKAIEAVFGVEGTVESGGVLLIDLPRTDLHPTLFGVSLEPDAGFDTEITFQPISQGAIVKWEFCLLDREVNPVLDSVFNQNLQPRTTNFNAIHNHFLEVEPEVKFVHGTAIGDPVQIAKGLRDALEHSHQPFVSSGSGNTHLPNKEITEIIGGTSMVSDSVLTVSVERKDRFRELGILLEPDMQVDSMINFQSIGEGHAAAVAEIPVLPQEADAVARTLREHDFYVTALHNHELFIEPDLYYLHAFGTDEPLSLARAIRAALNHANSKFQ